MQMFRHFSFFRSEFFFYSFQHMKKIVHWWKKRFFTQHIFFQNLEKGAPEIRKFSRAPQKSFYKATSSL